jgi:hypothetical protein
MQLFVTEHLRHSIDRLLEAYSELALLTPQDEPLDAWLDEAQKELKDFSGHLPSRPTLALLRKLQTPLLSVAAGGGVTVAGFSVADWCLCYLRLGLAFLVPAVAVTTIPSAYRSARRLMSAAHDATGGRGLFELERGLARELEMPPHRGVPWGAFCWAAASAWFLLQRIVFAGHIYFKWHSNLIIAGGCAAMAVYSLVSLKDGAADWRRRHL